MVRHFRGTSLQVPYVRNDLPSNIMARRQWVAILWPPEQLMSCLLIVYIAMLAVQSVFIHSWIMPGCLVEAKAVLAGTDTFARTKPKLNDLGPIRTQTRA